jgi:dienelactone hydrolase
MFRGRPTTETIVFTVAVGVAALHGLDDAFLGRQPGVDLGQHALAGLIAVLAAVGGILLFPRSRPGVRAVMALGFGLPALVNGAMHIAHIRFDAPSDSDLTGVLAAGAGIVLIGLGASIPWRHRHTAPSSARRRWLNRLAAVPASAIVALFVIVPIAMAVFETHKPREVVGDPPSAAYQDVSFESSDGLRLRGWYRPSRNGATVLVIHGGGGDRTGAVDHARLLDRHGYGVLMYDARGRGESDGSPNSYGWDWEKDAAGALDHLHERGDVDPDRIGVLGLSSGADTAIDVAATRDDVAAVVSDGAALRTYEDTQRITEPDPLMGSSWVMFKAIGVMTGSEPSRPLEDLVAEVTSPLLLISAGTKMEKDANDLFAEAANEPFEHWNIPDAGHTSAVRSHTAEYERRVTRFLDGALLGS